MRTFDASELTKRVVKALIEAAASLHSDNHLVRSLQISDQANSYLELAEKIVKEKLDVRLVSRED